MTSPDLIESLRTARKRGLRPSAPSADLRDADLRDADLRGADLWGADLRGADLRYANLRYADLWGADLRGADLRYANLRDANLGAASWHGLSLAGLPSGDAIFLATADGWHLRVGCWTGTTNTLRTLIASDTGWPEATGEQVALRRPMLTALADMCDAYAAAHPTVVGDLAARWGTDTPGGAS